MRKLALFISLLLAISAVANDDSPKESVNEISLKGKRVQIPKEHIDKHIWFSINDIAVMSGNPKNLSTLTPEKMEGLEPISSPGEFECPHISKGMDNSLMIINTPMAGSGLTSLTVIKQPNNIEAIKDKSRWQQYPLQDIGPFRLGSTSFAQVSNSSILVAGAPFEENINNLFSIIDYQKQKVTTLKYWPKDGIKCPAMPKHALYVDNCKIFGNGNGRFVYQCEWSRLAFIFSIEGKNVNILKELYSQYPEYSSEDGMNFSMTQEQMKTELLSCIANNDRIYFLLKDSDRKGNKLSKSAPYIYGNTIEEYDWEGNKLRVINLNHYGRQILLSGDNKTLYLLTQDYGDNQVPKIWAYDLSGERKDWGTDEKEETEDDSMIIENFKDTVKIGDMMADFELYDYDDKPHHLNEFTGKGKYTILEFSSMGCAPCIAIKPTLELFYQKYKDRMEMITISSDPTLPWKQKPLGEVSWHEWNDHNSAKKIMKKYGVKAIPKFFVIDPSGKIVDICDGAREAFKSIMTVMEKKSKE
ncbi:MAG: TlpA family protein disulfide reductase [Prevotella sp.]|nr:TlpA family protein disulfide reductase [Prevotella sp.]